MLNIWNSGRMWASWAPVRLAPCSSWSCRDAKSRSWSRRYRWGARRSRRSSAFSMWTAWSSSRTGWAALVCLCSSCFDSRLDRFARPFGAVSSLRSAECRPCLSCSAKWAVRFDAGDWLVNANSRLRFWILKIYCLELVINREKITKKIGQVWIST